MSDPLPPGEDVLRIEKSVYGGDGLAHTAEGEVLLLPFVLPGELVEAPTGATPLRVIEPAPERVSPPCPHFGVCGGCQYQMASYPEQLRIKDAILHETMARGGLTDLPKSTVWPSEPWGYRNRIRLRVREVESMLRFGYSVRHSNEFLPIRTCPIAAAVLWATAEALERLVQTHRDAAEWLRSAAELELSCAADESRVGVHLLCPGQVPPRQGSFARFAEAIAATGVPVTSAGASRLHAASGRALASLAAWGADGLAYRVGAQSFWLARGSFFQVNRFLIATMIDVVCTGRQGQLAWDLYAGVGLFARALTSGFASVTAIEASPTATPELRRGLRPTDRVVEATSLSFLREAVVQRERPELIVLDPPRAGAGEEACGLLARLTPQAIVYVSCDPTTLARDAAVLTHAGYVVREMHLVDLFPQSYHLETVMVFQRSDQAR